MPALPTLAVPAPVNRATDRVVTLVRAHRLMSIGVTVVVIAAVVVGVRLAGPGTAMEQALSYAPGSSERVSFTDWAGIRDDLHADLDADSSAKSVEKMLDTAYDKDLAPTSVLTDSGGLLQDHYGWSPATLDWELYSQTKDGDLMVGHLPSSVDFDDLADKMDRMKFSKPKKDPDDGGVWDGTTVSFGDLDADSSVTPPITYVALLPSKHLVLTSDDGPFLEQQVDSLGDTHLPDEIGDVAGHLDKPLSAFMFTGDYTCSTIGLAKADPADQEQAQQLVDAAGKVNPVDAFAMANEPGGGVRAAMAFDDGDQARTNADTRAKLAVGPAPGQGGSFADRFKLGKVAADGSVLTMDMRPRPDQQILSDLANGPLLFATC